MYSKDILSPLFSLLRTFPQFCLKPEDTLATVHQKMEELRIRRLVVTGKQEKFSNIE
jgi:CBS domain-containing protein